MSLSEKEGIEMKFVSKVSFVFVLIGFVSLAYAGRFYDVQLGRWVEVDPVDEFHSPYSYVGNNPANYIDPSGLDTYHFDAEWNTIGIDVTPWWKFWDSSNDYIFDGQYMGELAVAEADRWVNSSVVEPAVFAVVFNNENYVAVVPPGSDAIEANPFIDPGLLLGMASGGARLGTTMYKGLPKHLRSFRFAQYTQKVLKDDFVVMRKYGGNSRAAGRYATDIGTTFQYPRNALAVRKSWSTMANTAYIRIPKGTTILKGKAAAQFPWTGGGQQIYIDAHPDEIKKWIIATFQ